MSETESLDWLDDDGYPTAAALTRIAEWPWTDIAGLIEFVRGIWNWPKFISEEGDKLHMSTGGWSGNESIIKAMGRNNMFWIICWEQSRRGGHYIFDLSRTRKMEKGNGSSS